MEIDEILEQLERHENGKPFPTEVVQAAIDKKEEITPYLIDNLKWLTANVKEVADDYDYMLHLYSLHLLAHFKEKQAFQVIIDLLTIPNKTEYEIVLEIIGDVCFGNSLARILADVSNADTEIIKSLIENREMPRFIREAAILSLTYLYARGEISRKDILDYFTFLFDQGFENENDIDDDVRTDLVINASHIYPEELYDKIKSYFDRDKIEEEFINLKDVQRYLDIGIEECLERVLKEGKPIDALNDMSSFLCFKTKEEEKQLLKNMLSSIEKNFSIPKSETAKSKPAKKVEPVRFVDTTQPKIGRNEPCPCGSGKKYKKCCLN